MRKRVLVGRLGFQNVGIQWADEKEYARDPLFANAPELEEDRVLTDVALATLNVLQEVAHEREKAALGPCRG